MAALTKEGRAERNAELKNKKFHYLELIEPFKKTSARGKRTWWKCKCLACGGFVEREEAVILNGATMSCGCMHPIKGTHRLKGQEHYNYNGCQELTGEYVAYIRNRAGSRDLCWEIDAKIMWNLYVKQDKKCALTGLEIGFSSRREKRLGNEQTASLDRIDSNKGYTLDNIQWVHKDINKTKMDFENERFIVLCNLVAKQHKRDV